MRNAEGAPNPETVPRGVSEIAEPDWGVGRSPTARTLSRERFLERIRRYLADVTNR